MRSWNDGVAGIMAKLRDVAIEVTEVGVLPVVDSFQESFWGGGGCNTGRTTGPTTLFQFFDLLPWNFQGIFLESKWKKTYCHASFLQLPWK